MNHIENYKYDKNNHRGFFKNLINAKYLIIFLFSTFGLLSCTSFVEVDPPKNTLVSATVYEDASTVESALANVYLKMRDDGLVSGFSSLSISMGAYSDNFDYYGSNTVQQDFYNHAIVASNTKVLSWWANAYKLIYVVNSIINGVEKSTALNTQDKEQFKGEGLFIRGFLHSILVELYGDIPYITTTNYIENNIVQRMSKELVYDQIIDDLTNAVNLLDDTDNSGQRVIPNRSAANALLARVYLYTENWELAESTASKLINAYALETDINAVFLKGSAETLWQFKPEGSSSTMNTREANEFIIISIPPQRPSISNSLLEAFEPGDARRNAWVGNITSTDGLTTLEYAHKYKARFNEPSSLEYTIIFRLSEQYLIRAEARTQLEDFEGAQDDLNAIRNRAALLNTEAENKSDLLEAIFQERRVELFAEHGHRWFDLKRLGKASEVLSPIKLGWKDTDVLFPVPENELQLNQNLKPQNAGY